jgi:hypothetical protein
LDGIDSAFAYALNDRELKLHELALCEFEQLPTHAGVDKAKSAEVGRIYMKLLRAATRRRGCFAGEGGQKHAARVTLAMAALQPLNSFNVDLNHFAAFSIDVMADPFESCGKTAAKLFLTMSNDN